MPTATMPVLTVAEELKAARTNGTAPKPATPSFHPPGKPQEQRQITFASLWDYVGEGGEITHCSGDLMGGEKAEDKTLTTCLVLVRNLLQPDVAAKDSYYLVHSRTRAMPAVTKEAMKDLAVAYCRIAPKPDKNGNPYYDGKYGKCWLKIFRNNSQYTNENSPQWRVVLTEPQQPSKTKDPTAAEGGSLNNIPF